MHKRSTSSSSEAKMNDANEAKVDKTTSLSQNITNKAVKTIRSIRRMRSFNRHLKNSNRHKNPDVKNEVPSYMRQTCSSLVKRNTFKRRSFSNSSKETSPNASEKSQESSRTKSRNSTSSPHSHSSDLDQSDWRNRQLRNQSVQVDSDIEGDESGTTISSEPYMITPRGLEEIFDRDRVVAEFVQDCFRNVLAQYHTTEQKDFSISAEYATTRDIDRCKLSAAIDNDDGETKTTTNLDGNNSYEPQTTAKTDLGNCPGNSLTMKDTCSETNCVQKYLNNLTVEHENTKDPSSFIMPCAKPGDGMRALDPDAYGDNPPKDLPYHRLEDFLSSIPESDVENDHDHSLSRLNSGDQLEKIESLATPSLVFKSNIAQFGHFSDPHDDFEDHSDEYDDEEGEAANTLSHDRRNKSKSFEIPGPGFLHRFGSGVITGLVGAALLAIGPSLSHSGSVQERETVLNKASQCSSGVDQDDWFFQPYKP